MPKVKCRWGVHRWHETGDLNIAVISGQSVLRSDGNSPRMEWEVKKRRNVHTQKALDMWLKKIKLGQWLEGNDPGATEGIFFHHRLNQTTSKDHVNF